MNALRVIWCPFYFWQRGGARIEEEKKGYQSIQRQILR